MNAKGVLAVLLLASASFASDKASEPPRAQVSVGTTAAPASSLLDSLVQEALEKNPAVQSAVHAVNAQRRRVPQAKSLPDPSVSVGWAGNIRPFSVQEGDPSSYRSVNVMQQVPFPGKLKLRGEIANKETNAAEADLEAARRKIATDLKAAYYDFLYYDKAIAITNKNKDLLDRLSKISEARYRVGKAMQADVLRSQVEISLLLQKLTMLEQQKEAAQARVNTLLVRPPDAALPILSDLQPTALRLSLDELYGLAAKNDTGVQREQSMIERGKLSAALAQKEYRPDLAVGYMYQQRPDMPDMHGMTFTVNIPVFYRTKQSEAVAQANEELAGSEKNRENRLNELRFELKQQYLAAKAAEQLTDLYSKAVVPQSSLALESSMSAYKVGTIDFLSMLANFSTLLNYETDYYRQVADHQIALSRMESLVGVDLTSEQSADQQGVKAVQK